MVSDTQTVEQAALALYNNDEDFAELVEAAVDIVARIMTAAGVTATDENVGYLRMCAGVTALAFIVADE